LLLVLSLTCSAVAQIDTATITGRVTDPSGSIVPNVQITVVQNGTNYNFQTATNAEGIYRIQSLQPGTYEITYQAPGFKQLVRSNIALRTGDVLPVDVSLEVGTTTESIKVSAQSTLLETETSSTGTVTEGDTLYKLPMYQRYVNSALNLVPGVSMNGYGYGGSLSGYAVNGQRPTGTAMFEDGVLGNHPQSSTGTDVKPIENSVEEVKVLTGTLPAEYGHSTGGVISVVKKSGSNEFHGMAADYGRTRSMTHRQFFNQYKTSQPQPGAPDGVPAWFMQPDANVSGPIIIPKLYDGRNKTFFFFGYQKLIEKKSAAMVGQTPTPAELAGDFSFGGLGNTLYDPLTTRRIDPNGAWTRDPFPGKQIPLNRFDPVAAKIIAINPWQPPNSPGSFSSTGPVSNYTWESRSRTFFEDYSGRVDQQFNSQMKAYGSYTYNHQSGFGRPVNIAIPAFDATNGNLTPFTQQNASAGFTYIINPTLLNDARVGYYRPRNDTMVPSYGQNWPTTLGIPNVDPILMPGFAPAGSNPTAGQLTPDSIYGLSLSNGPSSNITETFSFRDDLSTTFGTHAFKMGYEIIHFRANYKQLGQPSGVFQFDTMTAGLQPNGQPIPNTGNTVAGFELGAVRQATFSQYTTTWLPVDSINSLYFQDDWKISPTLTLNLGLRWSTESPYNTRNGFKSQFDANAIDPITGRKGAITHPAGSLNERDWKNFQPRFGLAWHPLTKWVFRGGFGINTVDIRFPISLQQFDEYQALSVQQRAPGDPRPVYQISQVPQPVQYNILPNGTAPYVGTNFGSRNITWMDSKLNPGYVMNWNTSIEFQVSANNLLKFIYQGSAGVHLVENWNQNAFPTDFGAGNPVLQNAAFAALQNYLPYPQFGTINYMSNTGHNTYHAGTVQFQKRYSQGLILDTFYTFSKVIDDCDSDGSVCTGVAPITNRNLNKGRATYDRNHRFIASATYELPVGRGRHFLNRGGVTDVIFGGWEIAWIQTIESGNPLSFTYAGNPANEWSTMIGNQVPNVVGKPSMDQFGLGDKIGGNRFNQALSNPVLSISNFSYPAAFTPGNAGRNIVTGPGLLWSEFSAKKNFKLSERFNLQFRYDFQNPFHNFNFSPPSTTVDFRNPQLFGKLTSDQTTASIGGQPLMNIMLRLSW
jgi:hypothetical protein